MAEIGDNNQLSPLLPVAPQKKVGPRKQPEASKEKEKEKRGRRNRLQSEQPIEESDAGPGKNRIDDYA